MNKDRPIMKYNYSFNNGDKIFFTSDTHFSHENIMRFCKRPFKNAEEMNETLIENWNDVVPKDGIVFHLGDFSFGNKEIAKNILSRLNGTIYLCLGNHDLKNLHPHMLDMFADVKMQYYIYIEDQAIYLNHFPFLCFAGTYRQKPVWQLFGHVHSTPFESYGCDIPRLVNLFPCQLDVGVDKWNYRPVSFNQIKEQINKQISNDDAVGNIQEVR